VTEILRGKHKLGDDSTVPRKGLFLRDGATWTYRELTCDEYDAYKSRGDEASKAGTVLEVLQSLLSTTGEDSASGAELKAALKARPEFRRHKDESLTNIITEAKTAGLIQRVGGTKTPRWTPISL